MKRTFKKAVCVFLVVAMLVCAAPLSGFVGLELPSLFDFKAQAASYSGTCGDNLTWSLDTETGLLEITGTGAMTDWSSAPKTPWYDYRASVTSVVIDEGVTSIGKYAFISCTNINSITIPVSVVLIELNAVGNSRNLKDVHYGSDEEDWAKIKINTNNKAFEYTTFHYVYKPVSSGTFGENLEWILYSNGELTISGTGSMPDYTSADLYPWYGYLSKITSVVIGDDVTSIGSYAFINYNKLLTVTVNSNITSIGDFSFAYCSALNTVVLPESVTSIGAHAFYNCSALVEITLPKGLNSIGGSAFYNCSSLTSITIPDDISEISNHTFYGCSGLKELTMPASAKIYNSNYVFYNCTGIEKVTLTKGNGTTQNYGTSTSETSDITNYRYTPWYLSKNCLKELVIADGVTSIGEFAFYGCAHITSLTIADSVSSIGNFAFYNCARITDLILPKTLSSIGQFAFSGCTGITNLTIPVSVKTIENSAFYCCSAIENIYYAGNISDWCKISFADSYANPMCEADNIYFNGELTTAVFIPVTVTSISNYAFYGWSSLNAVYYAGTIEQWQAVTVGTGNDVLLDLMIFGADTDNPFYSSGTCGENLEWIMYTSGELAISGSGAMYDYSASSLAPWYNYRVKITTVTLPEDITSIGNYAFNACISLTSITIPDSVTKIGNYAFSYCYGLKEITMPVSAKIYNSSYTFIDCINVEKITLTKGNGSVQDYSTSSNSNSSITYFKYTPWYISGCSTVIIEDGVQKIGNYMFYECSGITSISIPESIKSIGYSAFDSCSGLTEITIPDGISRIDDSTFYGCSSLTNIIIPDSVTYIDGYAFYGCSSLTNIIIPDNVKYIYSYAFYGCSGLEELTIPISVLNYSNAFSGCVNIGKITLTKGDGTVQNYSPSTGSNSGTYYQNTPWYTSGCTTIVIEEGVASIGSYTFYNCTALENVYYTGDVASWCAISFADCYANPMCEADNLYFGNELVTMVDIPETVITIGDYAFYGCSDITYVAIGNNITKIGQYAFGNCENLAVARYKMTYKEWNKVEAQDGNSYLTDALLLGLDSERLYIAAGDIGENITWYLYADNELCFVGEGDMANYTATTTAPWYDRRDKIKTVVISDGITSIGKNTFAECENINDVYIYGYDVSIANGVFDDCDDVNICCYSGSAAHAYAKSNNLSYTMLDGDSVGFTVMNGMVTAYSGNATNPVIPADVTAIGSYAFMNNDTITSIVLPQTVTDIYTGAFAGCVNLERIVVPESVSTIASTAFNDTDVVFACVENSYAHIYAVEHGIACEITNPANGIEFTSRNEYITVNGTTQLSVVVASGNKSVIWSSSNSSVASVDSNGFVTGKKAGVVVITATTSDGIYKDYCLVRVVGITGSYATNTVVDPESGCIYGLDVGLDSLSDYIELIDNSCTLEYDTLTDEIGTGTITNVVRNGEIIDSYTVVIFGDVDGNGWYDANDAFIVNMIASGLIDKSMLSEAMQKAADCNHDGAINELDFDLLIDASVLLDDIDQSVTQPELVSNAVYIQYCSMIDQSAGADLEPAPTPETELSDQETNQSLDTVNIEAIFATVFEHIIKIFAFVFSLIK